MRPGIEILDKAGGINEFMNWHGPTLTDSGGYQVFSLGMGKTKGDNLVKISDSGVEFRSHLDGSKHVFEPDKVIEMQRIIGSDIIMCLDECVPANSSYEYTKRAVERTHRWAKISLDHHEKQQRKSYYGHYQAIFGIVQGATHKDLRIESAKYIAGLNFDGVAIGGLSVGEKKLEMLSTLDIVEPFLPKHKPRYLMGVGSPIDLLNGIERGIDMFDCVLATRIARNGTVWTCSGKINLNNKQFRDDYSPIDKSCSCYACQNYTRSYIAHLVHEKETFGLRLTTIHNLQFLSDLMKKARLAIINQGLEKFTSTFKNSFEKE
jgi:queuine tRNA-ribosyltransferase